MPEELTLLPCPACSGEAVLVDEMERDSHGKVIVTWCVDCLHCHLLTGILFSREAAVAYWNALPRALEWTNEPQLGAWNWWRDENSRIPRYVYKDGTVAIAMQIDRVPYQDLGGQWCPIPEPREPKE